MELSPGLSHDQDSRLSLRSDLGVHAVKFFSSSLSQDLQKVNNHDYQHEDRHIPVHHGN